MPTYNGERYVAQALESVRREPTDGVEVVVVDDGSTDGTLDVVRRFTGAFRMRIIENERIGNWVAMTNVGLRVASAPYACLLHQDDFWLSGRVSAVRRDLEARGDFALLFHPATFVGPTGRRLGLWRCPFRKGVIPPDQFAERLLVQNFIAVPSPVFDRKVALEQGGLDESLWYTPDWDLWLRLGSIGPVRFLPEPLSAFRVHAESQTMARPRTANEFLAQMTRVLERHLATWPVHGRRRRSVERVARFSTVVNAALAAVARGQGRVALLRLVMPFLALRPSGWKRYVRDSRITDRVLSRMRVLH
jgi:glycosyltransferase involved in cell wall biosynthesis